MQIQILQHSYSLRYKDTLTADGLTECATKCECEWVWVRPEFEFEREFEFESETMFRVWRVQVFGYFHFRICILYLGAAIRIKSSSVMCSKEAHTLTHAHTCTYSETIVNQKRNSLSRSLDMYFTLIMALWLITCCADFGSRISDLLGDLALIGGWGIETLPDTEKLLHTTGKTGFPSPLASVKLRVQSPEKKKKPRECVREREI